MKLSEKILLATLFLSMLSVSIHAQQLSSSDERKMLLKIIDVLEDYQRFSNMDVDFSNYGNSFRDLFVDDEAPVYNDIYGLALGDVMSVKDYVNVMTSLSTTTRIMLKNIDRGDFYYENNQWKIDCTFDKYVNITDGCGTEFASDFYNTDDYKLTATLVYNADDETFRIEKIAGVTERKRIIPDNYRIIKKTRDLDEKVRFNGLPLDFNAVGQALIPPVGKLKYKDPNSTIKLVPDNIDCRTYHLKLRLKRWNIKMHYDFSNKEILDFGDTKNKIDEKQSDEKSYGVDFCYVVPSQSSFKVGFGFGAGMTDTHMFLRYDSPLYTLISNQDIDSDDYQRCYQNLSLAQNAVVKDLTVPLYFDFGIYFNKYVALTFDLGAKVHYNLSSNVTTTDGSAYTYGIYEAKYEYILLDEHFGYNGFGHNVYSIDNLDNKELSGISKLSIDAFGSAGLRINIPSTPLAIDANVSYTYGKLKPLIENKKTIGYNNPLIYNVINDMSSTEHMRNLTELVQTIYRKGIKFNIGLIVRL